MFKALTNLIDDRGKPRRPKPTSAANFPGASLNASRRGSGVAFIDPSDAVKSTPANMFSRNALDFISSASNNMSSPYTESQLLNAYLSSVYVYAALRRVANLISRVKIVGEVQQDGKWVRLPETHMLNQLFAQDGSEVLSRMWLNHAVYGAANVYKVKTRRAMLEEQAERPIYDFADGAVAGLYVLDKPLWDIDEDMSYGAIRGFYVNQYESGDNLLGNRNYLQREEVIYYTDWNPQSPNRGKSMVAVCIHEAVANASIAQWISEYFSRGAMPFIMVSMAEDDPVMMSDSDLRKYKKQFEEYWQGMGNSLRSVFFDRQINVEQVGIPADDVAAPELNETALEGIAATIGLDRELIVTPSGGSQERHSLLVKRAWEDTVIPLAEKYVTAINRDLGLPPNMQLVVDVSGIAELEADRENKADTEISIYESQLQSYNEARTRLKMSPVKELDGFYNLDGKLVPLSQMLALGNIPHNELVDYAMQLWDSNLALRSEVLAIVGRELPAHARDGYKYEIEDRADLIQSMWGDDLLPRTAVLQYLGFPADELAVGPDGYRSEIERGADYGEWITQLWDDNLLTRSQTLGLLDMGLHLPESAPDGYADEIGDRKSNIMDMWGDNLLTRRQTLERLGYGTTDKMIDGYLDEIEIKLDLVREAENERVERIINYWGDNLLTRRHAIEMLGLPLPDDMVDGYMDEVEAQLDQRIDADKDYMDRVEGWWGDNLVTRSQALNMLDIEIPDGMVDGYADAVENIVDEVSSTIAKFEAERLESIYNPESEDESVRYFNRETPEAPQDTSADWQALMAETVRPPLTPDDDATAAAEEDLLDGYGEYTHDVLEPSYGDYVDILPAEVLPTYEYETDEMFNRDSWLNDSEAEVRNPENHVPGDYYENVAAAYDDEYAEPIREVTTGNQIHADHNDNIDAIETDAMNEVYGGQNIPLGVAPIETPMFEAVDDFDLPLDELEVADRERANENETAQDIKEAESDLYVSLWIGENDKVKSIQDKVKSSMGELDIEWSDPNSFHVTLVYAPKATDENVRQVMSVLPTSTSLPIVEVEGISTFDNNDSTVIVLDVARNDRLTYLQSKIVTAFGTYGIALSPYSSPGNYNPHITLGYAPPGTKPPDIEASMFVMPETISVGRDGYETVDEIPSPEIKSILGYSIHDEPDGTGREDFMSEREKQESAKAFKAILRNNWSSRLMYLQRGKSTPMFGDKPQLPKHIKRALSAYSDSGKISAKVTKATIEAIQDGELDDNSWKINPIGKRLESNRAFQDSATDELDAWQRATLKSGIKKGVRFETFYINDELQKRIKSMLNGISDDDTESIKSLFGQARDELTKS